MKKMKELIGKIYLTINYYILICPKSRVILITKNSIKNNLFYVNFIKEYNYEKKLNFIKFLIL